MRTTAGTWALLTLGLLALPSPVAPQNANAPAARLRVPPGFTVELVAAPPLLEHPVMANVDARGRLFVAETASVIIQVAVYKRTGKRVFKMAPIHHHFEQLGWKESTVVIRFWIVSIILAMIGLSTLKLR